MFRLVGSPGVHPLVGNYRRGVTVTLIDIVHHRRVAAVTHVVDHDLERGPRGLRNDNLHTTRSGGTRALAEQPVDGEPLTNR